MPIGSNPNFYPNWFLDNETGKMTGLYIEYLEEIFRNIKQNYTLLDNDEEMSYQDMGEENLLRIINYFLLFSQESGK